MQAYFFDSSALVKRYIRETGTAWVVNIFRQRPKNQIYVAEVTLPEVVSALTRRHRGLSASSRAYGSRTNARFQRLFDDRLFKIKIDSPTIRVAARLAEKHFLRGYDAVQLAATIKVQAKRELAGASPLIFVTADRDL